MSNILQPELAPKLLRAELSRAGRPPARAKSELSRAELNSVATLEIAIKILKLMPQNYKQVILIFYNYGRNQIETV